MGDNKNFHTVRGYEIIEKEKKNLTHSMEDYLEMIYRIYSQEGVISISFISEALNVQPPSATKMVQKLTKLGYIDYVRYGSICLTEKGEEVGKFLLERHEIIEEFLKNIGVEKELLINIELMEHNLTRDALLRIKVLNDFLKENDEVKRKLEDYFISLVK